MSNDLFGVVALVLILGIGAIAFAPAYEAGGERVSVANESLTVDYDTNQSVDESGLRYDSTVTVRNASGVELNRGTDYEWDADNGTVAFANSSATSGGDEATITYAYRRATDQGRTIAGVLSGLGQFLTWALFLLAGGYVFREVT